MRASPGPKNCASRSERSASRSRPSKPNSASSCSTASAAVCSPKLVTGRNRLAKPSDVLKFPLLHLDDRKAWTKRLEVAGVENADTSQGPVLNRARMVIDAAVDGQGIALARTTLSAWDLINGRLIRPFKDSIRALQDILDRLPQGDVGLAQDQIVSGLVAGRSSAGPPASAPAGNEGSLAFVRPKAQEQQQ